MDWELVVGNAGIILNVFTLDAVGETKPAARHVPTTDNYSYHINIGQNSSIGLRQSKVMAVVHDDWKYL